MSEQGEPVVQELGEVVERAAEASARLRRLDVRDRAEMLNVVAAALDLRTEALAAVADSETSLGEERLRGEVARTAGQFRMFAAVLLDGAYAGATIDHARPEAKPVPLPDIRRYRTSIGPVAVFAASNFPFAFSVGGGDTASALAAGSAVVVKAHSGHPETSVLTMSVIKDALAASGWDQEVLQLVHGRAVGVELVCHPTIEAAAFTGSVAGGRALFDLAAARPTPIPFYGELGSINPFVVTERAARTRGAAIAQGLAKSFTLGSGQFCTKPGLVFVPDSASGRAMTSVLVGAASSQGDKRLLTARMLDGYRMTVQSLAMTAYSRVLLNGSDASATTVSPTILAADGADVLAAGGATPLLEECFGPTTVIVSYRSEGELDELLELVPQSLTGTLHAEPDEADPHSRAGRILAQLQARAGRVVWNGYPTGVPVTWATQHGGSYPSSTTSWTTSVGAAAIERFLRAVAFQDLPDALLPAELQEANPLGIVRRVDGQLTVPATRPPTW